jgi:hypothetical protein
MAVVSTAAERVAANVRDKQRLLLAAAYRLRPGGHLVVGDIMFGRGGNAWDWGIIGSRVVRFARHGPRGTKPISQEETPKRSTRRVERIG